MTAIEERILAKVERSANGCWTWTGRTNEKGYGYITVAGRSQRAHRIAYKTWVGDIPPGLQLDHTCHNDDPTCAGGKTCKHRACLNPAHLEPVTTQENSRRGAGPGCVNARKTHCKRGHAFDEANTARQVLPSGREKRVCRACRRERDRLRN